MIQEKIMERDPDDPANVAAGKELKRRERYDYLQN